MLNKLNKTFGAAVLVSAFAVPGIANAAASAIATADVNLRAGPSTRYPVVDVIDGGDNVRVYGCLESGSWCDVSYRGDRGWMSANYLAYLEGGRRYTDNVIARIGVPFITFSFGNYWNDYYRGYDFYDDWDYYDDRRELRREIRRERREDRREIRRERRDDRRDIRRDRREVKRERRDVRDARQELRRERRDGGNIRQERRQVRQERRELRDARRDLRRERRDR